MAKISNFFSSAENVPLKDCGALYNAGYTEPGIYLIDPSGNEELQESIRVNCDNGWTVILQRRSNQMDFDPESRDMENYIEGFGDIGLYDHWMGCSQIHRLIEPLASTTLQYRIYYLLTIYHFRLTLNQDDYEMRINLNDGAWVPLSARYSTFDLSSTCDLTIGGHSSSRKWYLPDHFTSDLNTTLNVEGCDGDLNAFNWC